MMPVKPFALYAVSSLLVIVQWTDGNHHIESTFAGIFTQTRVHALHDRDLWTGRLVLGADSVGHRSTARRSTSCPQERVDEQYWRLRAPQWVQS